MNKSKIYSLFEGLINKARSELLRVTKSEMVITEAKADRTLVSNCDLAIDKALSKLVADLGYPVISEEGSSSQEITKKGTYITIDPIDGTLGYLDYVNEALKQGNIEKFAAEDLGAEHDFCLLVGVIEDGTPRFGACYNYVTGEKMFLDAKEPGNLIWEDRRRFYSGNLAAYVDPRPGDIVEAKVLSHAGIQVIRQATLGLKSLYALTSGHSSSVACHRVQSAGLWDIAPAAVAAQAFGGAIFDDRGDPLRFNDYVILPGRGATILKGGSFDYVLNLLKQYPQ